VTPVDVALAWSATLAAVAAYAAAPRASSRRPRGAAEGATVLVVRPCAGTEPLLDRTLGSLARATSRARLVVRFALGSAADAAAPAAAHAAADLRARGMDADVLVTGARGPNHKAMQLAAAWAERPEGTAALLVADSDADLEGVDLDELLDRLLAPGGPGAVWAPPAERGPVLGPGDRASQALLGASLHAFPLLARLDAHTFVGKLFAVRASTLAAIGGLASLGASHGEDLELARRARASGLRVESAPVVVASLAAGRSVGAARDRYARWLTVIRAQRAPLLATYPALFLGHWLAIALAAASAPSSPARAAAAIAIAIGARALVAWSAARACGRRASPLALAVDALLADALLAAAFARAVSTRSITWRGRALAVGPLGTLLELPREPAR
jgi:ceramide glucosyltransferase